WVPALPQPRILPRPIAPGPRLSRRVIAIVIDGCRADRLREARTPFIDRFRAEGTDFVDMNTVYPARTVTGFSSMLTGASPAVHGMKSNFVPSLGVKCDSIFATLRRAGLTGKLVGIAHLIDAFGEDDVSSVTAVMHNDAIDAALVARAQQILDDDDPDVLVLQLLRVDQTGHARGSYNAEYLRAIEATDRTIETFLGWCGARGYLDDATVIITADHGQGIGIGGHGHMSPPERQIPCILWGAGVSHGIVVQEQRFITDIAPTITHLLGLALPNDSSGRALVPLPSDHETKPSVAFIIPAHNEAQNIGVLLARIRDSGVTNHVVLVVDDGSRDGTAAVAEAMGAIVVRHERNRGLGAALRTGLAAARGLEPRAAIYLDADGEYDPREAMALLSPIERGEADYVLGSRFRGAVRGMTRSRRVANWCFSAALSVAAGRWISDGQTGYRAFSQRALDVAEIIHDYNYAQVLTLDLLHKGMRMVEVPVTYQRRRRGRSFISAAYLWRVPAGMVREMLSH
ncbi:MAG: glycosyltransferase, partial [Dehalococcoidia bacterium]